MSHVAVTRVLYRTDGHLPMVHSYELVPFDLGFTVWDVRSHFLLQNLPGRGHLTVDVTYVSDANGNHRIAGVNEALVADSHYLILACLDPVGRTYFQ